MAGRTANLAETKIKSEFDKLDLNHDGYLDWSDYETLIDRYKRTARVSDDDRRARAGRSGPPSSGTATSVPSRSELRAAR